MNKLILKLKNLPAKPGIYQFLDKNGEVLYIGKAKNLRARVRQYFKGADERPQVPFLMKEASDFNYTVVANELEALYLENTLIKQYLPKYNIDLRDDKNYAFIKIDYSTEIPGIGYARKIETEGMGFRVKGLGKKKTAPYTLSPKPSLFFGPYSAAYKIRNTLNMVRKIFPYCAAKKVSSRPCFYYYLHRCPGVCAGKISLDDYKLYLNNIIAFLQGDFGKAAQKLKTDMKLAARQKKFELAARLRDQLRALEILNEKQNVILTKKVDWDIISIALSTFPSPYGRGRTSDGRVRVLGENIQANKQQTVEEDAYACVNLFKIRGGKMLDKDNFIYRTTEKYESADAYKAETLQRFLEQYYLEASSMPKVIYTQQPAQNGKLIADIIKSRFKKSVSILCPQKNRAKKLIDLGKLNAEEYFKNWLGEKTGSGDKINRALQQLKEILNLPAIPKRIEGYDISNIQGTNAVGSMVVFVDGRPKKSEYRKFKIQGKSSPDDFYMMKEMLTRRFKRSVENFQFPISNFQKNHKPFQWPLPDLIVIDGGKGQLSAALSVLQATSYPPAGRTGKLPATPIIGLAKRIEEIFMPEKSEPIILSHDQPALQLLQRLRDEAHRFGITFHRKLRSKQAVQSALDDIQGVGPKTKKLLKTKFGTVAEIRKANLEELAAVVGQKLAEILKVNL